MAVVVPLRRGPSGKRIAGTENDQALVWNSTLKDWIPESVASLMPGAPIYDVTKPPFNTTGVSLAADDTNALAAAFQAANTTPGVVYLSKWHRVTGILPPLQNNNVIVTGRGAFNGGTILQVDVTSGVSALQVLNCQYSGFMNLWTVGARALTTGWGVRLQGTYRGIAKNLLVSSFGQGVEVDRCTLTEIQYVNLSDIYGAHNHYAHGLSGTHNHAVKYRDCNVGTSYPLTAVGQARDWAQNTLFVAGQICKANGNLYQCLQGGTSAGSGTGPSGLPTTNIATLRSTPITDGTVLWVFAMPATAAYEQGSWAHTFEVLDCGALQGDLGILVHDDAPASGSEPLFSRSHNLQVDHAYGGGVHLRAGSAHDHDKLLVISTLAGDALQVTSGVDGDWSFDNVSVFGCAGAGMTIGRGDGTVHNARFGAIGTATSNTRDCIEVAAGVQHLTVNDCTLGRVNTTAITNRYGLSLGAGCDNYTITGNRGYGVTGGFLNTPGAAATRVLSGNIGTVL